MSDRKKAIERLRAVELAAGMSSHEMLSAIGRAVLPDAVAWVPYSCDGLRNEIVELLEDADRFSARRIFQLRTNRFRLNWLCGLVWNCWMTGADE